MKYEQFPWKKKHLEHESFVIGHFLGMKLTKNRRRTVKFHSRSIFEKKKNRIGDKYQARHYTIGKSYKSKE